MVRRHTATFCWEFPSSAVAATIEQALMRETDEIEGDRATATVTRDDTVVRVRIRADDVRALRAAKHTWCTLMAAAEGTVAAGPS